MNFGRSEILRRSAIARRKSAAIRTRLQTCQSLWSQNGGSPFNKKSTDDVALLVPRTFLSIEWILRCGTSDIMNFRRWLEALHLATLIFSATGNLRFTKRYNQSSCARGK